MENLTIGEKTKRFSEFYLDIYNRTYIFMLGLSKEEANAKLSERLGVPVDIGDVQDCHGAVDKLKGKDVTVIYIYVHTDEPGTLAHEIGHAASHTFSHAGIRMDVDNDEPYTYLLGWITRKVYEALK